MTSTTSMDSTDHHKKHQRKRKRSILTIVLVGLVLASTAQVLLIIRTSQRVVVRHWRSGADGWWWNTDEHFFGAATAGSTNHQNEDQDQDEDQDPSDYGVLLTSRTKNHVEPGGNVGDQEQKQQQGKGKQKLPYLVMFVGPMKTASTTLQSALTILEQKKILAKDNYVYLGRRPSSFDSITSKKGKTSNRTVWSPMVEAIFDCGRNYTECWKEYGALDVIEDLALKRKNAIIYEEYLWSTEYDIHALQQSIQGKLQLIVVVGYRRLFSWLPSWKNQMEKRFDSLWPKKLQRDPATNLTKVPAAGMAELALNRKRATRAPPFFRAEAYSPAESHDGWTVDVLRRYQSWNAHSNIRIFNMHHRQGDVISHFLCDILPHSKRSCAAASLVATAMKKTENPSVDMDFSLIAVEAMDRDFLDPKRVTRQQAVTYIRQECLQKNIEALSPLPMECLDPESEQLLLSTSIRIERELVANFSDTSPHLKEFLTQDEEERHRESFRKSTKKFCSANLTAIFANPLWRDCLSKINKKATKISTRTVRPKLP
mmetsp:Transcript_51067/g.143548  ORF Transcript_51067/g.143548 Transcript_51067/m.143548 type:complete len:541 (-) Transcript_51067:95-1717(-)